MLRPLSAPLGSPINSPATSPYEKDIRTHRIAIAILISLSIVSLASFGYHYWLYHSFSYISVGCISGSLLSIAIAISIVKKRIDNLQNKTHTPIRILTRSTTQKNLKVPTKISNGIQIFSHTQSTTPLPQSNPRPLPQPPSLPNSSSLSRQSRRSRSFSRRPHPPTPPHHHAHSFSPFRHRPLPPLPSLPPPSNKSVLEKSQQLLKAVAVRDAKKAQSLLKDHATLSEKDENGCNAFLLAAKLGEVSILKAIQEQLPETNFNERATNGHTALMLAGQAGHVEAFRFLLPFSDPSLTDQQGHNCFMLTAQNGFASLIDMIDGQYHGSNFDFNAKDKQDKTALMLASEAGHVEAVKLLLSLCNPNEIDSQKRTSLMLAVMGDKEAVVKAHLNAIVPFRDGIVPPHFEKTIPNLNLQDEEGNTALMLALKNMKWALASSLMEKPFNSNLVDNQGFTPLMIAITKGRMDMVSTLLQKGANPCFINPQTGLFPLLFALQYRYFVIAELLMKDPGVKKQFDLADFKGNTPLIFASVEGSLPIVKILVENKVNLNSQNKRSLFALLCASANGHAGIVEFLCQHGADRKKREGDLDETPLIVSAGNGRSSIVSILTQSSREQVEKLKKEKQPLASLESEGIDLVNRDGESALMLAAQRGFPKSVKWLLLAGAKTDLQKKNGKETALMMAVSNGKFLVVKELVEHGANLHLKNSQGQTALAIAAQKKKLKIADFLLKNGARKEDLPRYLALSRSMTRLLAGEDLTKMIEKREKKEKENESTPRRKLYQAYQEKGTFPPFVLPSS